MKVDTKYVHAQRVLNNFTEFEQQYFELETLRLIQRMALSKSDEESIEPMSKLINEVGCKLSRKHPNKII